MTLAELCAYGNEHLQGERGQERLCRSEPRGQAVFSRGVEKPSHGADVRRSCVVDVVVEEEERELGENADEEDAAGHTLGIQ